MTKKMKWWERWWDVLFPPSPMKIARRDRRAIERGIELTDPEEFVAIKQRQDDLEQRVNLLETWKELMTRQEEEQVRGEEDAAGTTE